ncbi:LPXTG-motif cell wall anchor domain-containing protein [Clostridium collagenovorans DSM 3089]|uniref:LPXTG-motif cell wall anchor domain-containing protein n=1 Tax=Clostridium collagenovorans DSM 3089 TaxID=1121306 RepID=A0A1M5X6H4_9CLOT|nr:immunoglobulin-like domain-containing protein [Clostridium collagenovorans]SHH95415.1 LPXTG-motif cell wall anchor domain-containing protein [Clostridium collagenovorans DSM 3089]
MKLKSKKNKIYISFVAVVAMIGSLIGNCGTVFAEENWDSAVKKVEQVRKTDLEEEKKVTLTVEKNLDDIPQKKKVDIEILIDASGSMKEKDENMQQAKNIINKFISGVDGNYDRVGITVFKGPSVIYGKNDLEIKSETSIKTIYPLGKDLNAAMEAVNSIKAGGFTPLLDGLAKAEEDLDNNSRADADEKILIVLGDGHPNIGPERDYYYSATGNYYGEHSNYYPGSVIKNKIDELNKKLNNDEIDFEEYDRETSKLSKELGDYPGAEKKVIDTSYINTNALLKGRVYDNSKAEFYDLRYLIEQRINSIKNKGYKVYSMFLNNEQIGSSNYREFLEDTKENESLFRMMASDESKFSYAGDLAQLTKNLREVSSDIRSFNYNLKDTVEQGYSIVPGSFKCSVEGIKEIVNNNAIEWHVNNIGDRRFEVSYNIVRKIPQKLNNIPNIRAEDVTIKEGDKFDALKLVTAEDKEDGIIPSGNIKVLGKVDTNKVGKYEITYEVTDSNGAKAIKRITVTVVPKMQLINSIPIIKAEDVTIKEGDKFEALELVTAEDKEDGIIPKENIKVLGSVDTNKVGKYEITYEVVDSNGGKAIKKIIVTVDPAIKKEEGVAKVTPKKESKKKENSFVKQKDSPKTGDFGAAQYLALGLISLSSLGLGMMRKRK